MATSLRRISRFSPETLNKLAGSFYVYALLDPRRSDRDPKRYFYVGKGERDRCFQHALEELKQRAGEPSLKLKTINEIRRATGTAPPVEILDRGLTSDAAFRLESILIKLLGTEGNAVLGHRSKDYCISAEGFDASCCDPLSPRDIGACALLVNLNGTNKLPAWPKIVPQELDSRVLGDWPISQANAERVEYVVGVWAQVIRCVYRTYPAPDRCHRFKQSVAKNGRPIYKVRFFGVRSPEQEQKWCDHSIVSSQGPGALKLWTKFPPQRGSTFMPAPQ